MGVRMMGERHHRSLHSPRPHDRNVFPQCARSGIDDAALLGEGGVNGATSSHAAHPSLPGILTEWRGNRVGGTDEEES